MRSSSSHAVFCLPTLVPWSLHEPLSRSLDIAYHVYAGNYLRVEDPSGNIAVTKAGGGRSDAVPTAKCRPASARGRRCPACTLASPFVYPLRSAAEYKVTTGGGVPLWLRVAMLRGGRRARSLGKRRNDRKKRARLQLRLLYYTPAGCIPTTRTGKVPGVS